MTKILIKQLSSDEKEWIFLVTIEENKQKTEHRVILTKDYFDNLAEESGTSAETLVQKSIQFLLERENKESILAEFDLKIINNYFPEYEDEIKERLKNK